MSYFLIKIHLPNLSRRHLTLTTCDKIVSCYYCISFN